MFFRLYSVAISTVTGRIPQPVTFLIWDTFAVKGKGSLNELAQLDTENLVFGAAGRHIREQRIKEWS